MAYAETIFAIGDLIFAAPAFFAGYLENIIRLWANVGLAAVSGSWREALAFVNDAGIFGLVVSVGLVIGSWWIISKGVDRVV